MSVTRMPELKDQIPTEMSSLDDGMVELALLLPNWQAEALQSVAKDRGISTGQMLRSLIRDFFVFRQYAPVENWDA